MTRRANDVMMERFVLPFDHVGSGNWTTPAAKATGTITCPTFANLDDNDTITIGDGIGAPKVFEFDTAGDGASGSNIAVDVSGETTAAEVAAVLAAAITANMPNITVVDNADGTLSLTNDVPGAAGNVTITEAITHASGAVTGMSGGTDAAINTTGDTTISLWKPGRPVCVDRVTYQNPTGLAEDADNHFAIKLLKGETVVASKSTDSDGAGDNNLDAATWYELTMSATAADAVFNGTTDEMKLFLDEGGTASLPPGRIVVEGRYL